MYVWSSFLLSFPSSLLVSTFLLLSSLPRAAGQSLYEILGVEKTATPDQIKKAYRKVRVHYLAWPIQ